ncbi:hypothetical protein AGMMS49546_10070 [Spirochaetia bacterium]|nr:hypothetical protein AGMMS49546_10070 [Spirochaetia bacterium]
MDDNLKEKIKHEINRIDKLFSAASPLIKLCNLRDPDFIESSAVALVLHSFYIGTG